MKPNSPRPSFVRSRSNRCRQPAKKQSSATATHAVTRCEPENIAEELNILRRLKVKYSGISCRKGAGLGLFTTSNKAHCNPRQVIFDADKVILRKISGISAFQLQNDQTGKMLAWLQYDKLCMPLRDDSNILWSNFFVGNIEMGIEPDGLAVYLNDSPDPNCTICPVIKAEFAHDSGIQPYAFPHTQIPIEFEAITLKPIGTDTELRWSYRPVKKTRQISKKIITTVDFLSTYLQKEHTEEDHQTIKEIMAKTFTNAVDFTITDNFSDIQQKRYEDAAKISKKKLCLENKELEHINNKKYKNHTRSDYLLNLAKRNTYALIAYFKHHLDKSSDHRIMLSTTAGTLSNKKNIPVPHKSGENDDSRFKWFAYDVYRFCYESSLLRPEDDVMTIPFQWLAEKIDTDRDNDRWIVILKKRLQISLMIFHPSSLKALRNNMNGIMPNPLNLYMKKWTNEEMERLAGFHRPNHRINKHIIDYYYKTPQKTKSFNKIRQEVYEKARRGDIAAQKIIIKRRLGSGARINTISKVLSQSKVQLLINGTYQTPSRENIVKFIKQYFSKEDQVRLAGYAAHTDNQLIKAISSQKKHMTGANYEICLRLRSTKNTKLLKRYIEVRSKTVTYPSLLLRNLNRNGIKYNGRETITFEHLRKLFIHDKASSLQKFFHQTSKTGALSKFDKGKMQAKRYMESLLARCRSDKDFSIEYIKKSWQQSCQPYNDFCKYRAKYLRNHNIPVPFPPHLWSPGHIKQIISNVTKGTFYRNYNHKYQRTIKTNNTITPENQTPHVKPGYVSVNKNSAIAIPVHAKKIQNKWKKEKWCGNSWWCYSSELADYAATCRTDSLHDFAKEQSDLYRWLKRMRTALVDAKTNQQARRLYPDDFTGTLLTNQNINIMVGWINNSLENIGLPRLQDLAFH